MKQSNLIPLPHLQATLTNQKVEDNLVSVIESKKEMYAPDFNKFLEFCEIENRQANFDSMEKYLHNAITEQGIKQSTFNRRAAGVSFYLKDVLNEQQSDIQKNRLKVIRQLYNTEKYLRLKPMRGVRAERQEEVLALINKYETNKKVDIRKRAICFVNLITANRPSEMVRMKVSDFDLANRTVWVMMKKQGDMKEKKLTLECAKAIDKYIILFKLSADDYFVGATDKWGNYTSRMITERSYNRLIHDWLGFAPYTLRKTQITHMHKQKADLATIAKQSGHKSLQTITTHYLEVNTSDVEDYL